MLSPPSPGKLQFLCLPFGGCAARNGQRDFLEAALSSGGSSQETCICVCAGIYNIPNRETEIKLLQKMPPEKPKKPYSCMISRKPSKVLLNPQPLRTLNPIKDPTTQRIQDPKLQRTSHPKALITGSPSLTLRLERGFWAQRGVWGYFDPYGKVS